MTVLFSVQNGTTIPAVAKPQDVTPIYYVTVPIGATSGPVIIENGALTSYHQVSTAQHFVEDSDPGVFHFEEHALVTSSVAVCFLAVALANASERIERSLTES